MSKKYKTKNYWKLMLNFKVTFKNKQTNNRKFNNKNKIRKSYNSGGKINLSRIIKIIKPSKMGRKMKNKLKISLHKNNNNNNLKMFKLRKLIYEILKIKKEKFIKVNKFSNKCNSKQIKQ